MQGLLLIPLHQNPLLFESRRRTPRPGQDPTTYRTEAGGSNRTDSTTITFPQHLRKQASKLEKDVSASKREIIHSCRDAIQKQHLDYAITACSLSKFWSFSKYVGETQTQPKSPPLLTTRRAPHFETEVSTKKEFWANELKIRGVQEKPYEQAFCRAFFHVTTTQTTIRTIIILESLHCGSRQICFKDQGKGTREDESEIPRQHFVSRYPGYWKPP